MNRLAWCAGVGVLLTGCAGGLFESDVPAPQVYVLAPAARSESGEPLQANVAIGNPQAAPGLDSDRIAVLYADRRLDYYAAAHWGANAPQVMQSLLLGSLQNRGRFRSVVSGDSSIGADIMLDLELRDFQAEYGSAGDAPTVRVTVVAGVIDVTQRRLLAVVPATATVAAADDRLTAVVAAFESAAHTVAAELERVLSETLLARATDF